jgi:hypothetical protein
MKLVFLTFIAAITSFAANQLNDWKVVSQTENCPEKIQIKAKAGEKYVIAVNGISEVILFSDNLTGYNPDSMNAVQFVTKETKTIKKDQVSYSFIQPSYVENRPAKLEIHKNGKIERCPLVAL